MGQYQQRANPHQPRFTIGQDHHGWWIVKDRLDRVGGMFSTEDAARHFAVEEAGHDASQIIVSSAGKDLALFPVSHRQNSIGCQILENNRRLHAADARGALTYLSSPEQSKTELR